MKLTELQKLAGLPVTESARNVAAVRADKNGFTWGVALDDAIEYIISSTYGPDAYEDQEAMNHRLDLQKDPEQVESWIRNATAEDIGNFNWVLVDSPTKPDLDLLNGSDFDGMWLVDHSGDEF